MRFPSIIVCTSIRKGRRNMHQNPNMLRDSRLKYHTIAFVGIQNKHSVYSRYSIQHSHPLHNPLCRPNPPDGLRNTNVIRLELVQSNSYHHSS